ncbi:MAG: pilus assembly protein [Candidatus Obscuribacter sp.]|nr:pilus assembly protein [Candidatus Obscuribacter sp.]MBL0189584.1 pilus assembly protein [Candidatus Obscuribacter sp.]MBP6351159.1 pilus assembly protein [Candidatus Obscuribacter sp.]MBP6595264.1 pilus assembly protein [Candidatus Obscuribacter sp.]MDQ5968460.1 Pilus assembly protein [Cyanobacteriota bacterium erpe_2018_sw_39hr_WHONDRS-SW48-000098_B_bin.30]
MDKIKMESLSKPCLNQLRRLLMRQPPLKPSGRRPSGGVLVEAVLSSCFFVPLIVFLIWGVLEVSFAYVIGVNMTEASQLAARALADEFTKNPRVAQSEQLQQQVFERIRIPNMVSCNEQFEIPAGGWVTKTLPRSITVNCTYLPGAGNPALPLFPSPDPLKIGSKVSIRSSSTTPLF